MADEQPNSPSADVTTSDVETAPADSGASEQEPSGSRSWWDRLMGRGPRDDQEAPPDAKDRADTAAQTSKTVTLTEEELQRRIQSEADRRETRRAADEKARQRRELRDKDPWAYAEQERKEEEVGTANGQLTQFLTGIGTEHDRVSIDPIVLALPETERTRILGLEGAGVGLEGRKLVVGEALKALEKQWRAEGAKQAEERLRRNPAFRKQVLADIRGTETEPDLLPASGPSASDQTVSGLLRRYYSLPTSN